MEYVIAALLAIILLTLLNIDRNITLIGRKLDKDEPKGKATKLNIKLD